MKQLNVQNDMLELLEYNTPQFPVRCREADLAWFHHGTSECHWHDDLEFLVVLDGAMTYYVNNRPYRLEQGMGIFVNSGRLHYGSAQDHCRHLFCVIGLQLMNGHPLLREKYLEPLFREGQVDAVVLKPDNSWQWSLLNGIMEIAEIMRVQTMGYEFRLLSRFELMLSELCAHVVFDQPVKQKFQKEVPAFKQIVSYIRRHYPEKLQLQDLAAAGAVCRNKCYAIFQTTVGQSPMAYLNNYRLLRSAGLLVDSEQSITEIAENCGFGSASYFSKLFREHYQMSPRAYREQQRQK